MYFKFLAWKALHCTLCHAEHLVFRNFSSFRVILWFTCPRVRSGVRGNPHAQPPSESELWWQRYQAHGGQRPFPPQCWLPSSLILCAARHAWLRFENKRHAPSCLPFPSEVASVSHSNSKLQKQHHGSVYGHHNSGTVVCPATDWLLGTLHSRMAQCLASPTRTPNLLCSAPLPPLETPPLQSPPAPGRPSLHCFARQYPLRWFVLPICHTHVLALLSHHFKSVSVCVFCDILSPNLLRTACSPHWMPL